MSSYIYDQPDHAHCFRQDYYAPDKGSLVLDGSADINITFEDDLIKFDQQNYLPNGDLGNHNVYHYNKNWVKVYTNYGGLKEETTLVLNKYNQKETYKYMDNNTASNETVIASYNPDGGNINYCYVLLNGSYWSEKQVYFTYNELDQITGGTAEIKEILACCNHTLLAQTST